MKKQILFLLSLFALFCGIVSCGNMFKPSTNLGEQIVNDVDPNLIDINKNIKPFSDSLSSTGTSMRDANDTFPPGYQWNPPFITAGRFTGLVSSASEDIIGYLEFRPGYFRITSSIYTSLRLAHIDSVVLCLRRLRVTTRSSSSRLATVAKIDVDACPVLDTTSLLLGRFTDSIPFTRNLISNPKILGTLSINTDSSVHDSTLGGDTAFSMKLDSSIYVTRFKNAVKDSEFDTSAFAFFLAPQDNGDGVARFMNINGEGTSPRLVVYYHASDFDTALKTQTLYRDHASNTALESDSALACKTPVSSWETIRRAVFQIDVSSLDTFMDAAAPDNKKYVVIQKADVNIPISNSISDMRLDSILVYYKLFDTLATNINNFLGVSRFFIRDSIANDTSYMISLANMLQPLVVNHKSKSVYLFLWFPVQNSPTGYGPPFIQVAWKPDSKLKLSAIVTNPR